jgi:hypothetical protein
MHLPRTDSDNHDVQTGHVQLTLAIREDSWIPRRITWNDGLPCICPAEVLGAQKPTKETATCHLPLVRQILIGMPAQLTKEARATVRARAKMVATQSDNKQREGSLAIINFTQCRRCSRI